MKLILKINLILFFSIFSLSYSQEKGANKLVKGILGGINLSNYSREHANAEVGFSIGGFVDYPISNKLSAKIEAKYSLKNGYISVRYNIFDENNNLVDSFRLRPNAQMGSIDIPILFQYKIYNKFFIEAGPQISFLVNSKIKDKNKNTLYPQNIFAKTQFYGNIGIGYIINDKISIDFLHEIGFTKNRKTLNRSINTFGLNIYYNL